MLQQSKEYFKERVGENETRSQMIFCFDYLPTGLFNRMQTRLYHYSDESNMWKNGSFLTKNHHKGIVKKLE